MIRSYTKEEFDKISPSDLTDIGGSVQDGVGSVSHKSSSETGKFYIIPEMELKYVTREIDKVWVVDTYAENLKVSSMLSFALREIGEKAQEISINTLIMSRMLDEEGTVSYMLRATGEKRYESKVEDYKMCILKAIKLAIDSALEESLYCELNGEEQEFDFSSKMLSLKNLYVKVLNHTAKKKELEDFDLEYGYLLSRIIDEKDGDGDVCSFENAIKNGWSETTYISEGKERDLEKLIHLAKKYKLPIYTGKNEELRQKLKDMGLDGEVVLYGACEIKVNLSAQKKGDVFLVDMLPMEWDDIYSCVKSAIVGYHRAELF